MLYVTRRVIQPNKRRFVVDFLMNLLARLRGEPSVTALVQNLEKQQAKLAAAAKQLQALAHEKRKTAAEMQARAEANAAEADRADRICCKIGDLIK